MKKVVRAEAGRAGRRALPALEGTACGAGSLTVARSLRPRRVPAPEPRGGAWRAGGTTPAASFGEVPTPVCTAGHLRVGCLQGSRGGCNGLATEIAGPQPGKLEGGPAGDAESVMQSEVKLKKIKRNQHLKARMGGLVGCAGPPSPHGGAGSTSWRR